jgi:hypothetical protein
MSNRGLYRLTSAVHMCDDIQGYQEEPSPPVAGKMKAQAQRQRCLEEIQGEGHRAKAEVEAARAEAR